MIKFSHIPYFTITNKVKTGNTFRIKTLFQFDKKGELFVDEDNAYIERLKNKFAYEVVSFKPAEKAPDIKGDYHDIPDKVENNRKCKYCGYECIGQGNLLAHIRKEHKKEQQK
jgi:hypothetical protein